jgi:tetratricopeptide (TPR) repeat protein
MKEKQQCVSITGAVAIFVIALLLPAAASADDQDVCQSESKTVPVSAKLDACTRLIASGAYAGSALVGIMLNRGNAYYDEQDYPRAIADYNEAVRIDPTYAFAFDNRGLAYERAGDLDRAVADYSEAIRLHPGDADAFSGRAAAYEAKGDLVRAAADRNSKLDLERGIPNPIPH